MKLIVENVTAGYGEMIAIRNVSIEAGDGALVALIGANGAGKTTLLRTISGLVRAREGAITFDGRRIDGRPPHRIVQSGLLHVPEGRGMLPRMTVQENLVLGARAGRGTDRKFGMERIEALFPVLKERLHQPCDMLSGGEQQMLAIARALLANPRLLIIDELSLGLSPIVTLELLELLTVLKSEGVGILLVDQNIQKVLDVADRAYIMLNGRIVTGGTPEELRSEETLLASFFG